MFINIFYCSVFVGFQMETRGNEPFLSFLEANHSKPVLSKLEKGEAIPLVFTITSVYKFLEIYLKLF